MTVHILAVSGGKDSTAMVEALMKYEPRDYILIANPTGNELPMMGQHLQNIEARVGLPIQRIGCGLSLEDVIYREQCIPNQTMRFCTRILKIEPTQQFMQQFDDAVLYVGLRADEQGRKGADYGVECRFPFREWGWGLKEVRKFLREQKVSIPRRTDCAFCYDQQIAEWWALWRWYPEFWKRGEKIERDMGHTFRSPTADTWPAPLEDLRKSFKRGHTPKKAPNRPKLTDRCMPCAL